jgi:hypothetical protein
MRKFGADLLDTPDGTTLIELTFFANEGGRGAGENPYMSVSGLFTDQRGNHPGHTAELRVEDKVGGLTFTSSDCKGKLSSRLNRDMNKPRLLAGRYKRSLCFRGRGKNVQQKVGWKAIRDVRRKVKVVLPNLPER